MFSTQTTRHWHDRAAEMRVLAEMMTSVETRAAMLRLADEYDELGDGAEVRRSGEGTSAKAPKQK